MLDGDGHGVAGLAVVIGGIVMTNTLFMSVFERTREIGVLRCLGWRRRQVLALILGESIVLALLGGLVGQRRWACWLSSPISRSRSLLSVFGSQFTPDLFVPRPGHGARAGAGGRRVSGLVGQPPAAGGGAAVRRGRQGAALSRLPGGMTVRNLWRQRTRTALTLLSIGVSIAAIVALGGFAEGMLGAFTTMMAGQPDRPVCRRGGRGHGLQRHRRAGGGAHRRPARRGSCLRHVLDRRQHRRDAHADRVRLPPPRVRHPPLSHRRGRAADRPPPDPSSAGWRRSRWACRWATRSACCDSNFRVVGIYETGLAFEDAGVVIGLREAQSLTGKPRQVQFYLISLRDPEQAEAVKADLEAAFPEIDFSLTSELAESMSDFRVMEEMVGQISFVAVLIGGVGMLNTMLMSVLERTREIGVLRAWAGGGGRCWA